MKRRTRAEQRAHTRSCLLEAAGRVFAKRGLQQASIDEVAGEAGYTKGAFYANFKSKEELFLAMLDERFAERIEAIEEVLGSEEGLEAQTQRAAADFTQYLRADQEWERLFFEFAAHAGRDPDFREELMTRYRGMRGAIAAAFRGMEKHKDSPPPIAADEVALMTCAMSNGFALEQLLESGQIPDELYARMLYVFFTGLETLTARNAEAPA